MTVTGAVTDNLSGPAAVLCNATAATVSGNTWTCGVPVTDGDNPISVSATDAAGNSAMTSVTVRHVTGASIRITSPASLITVGASPIDVTGTVSGNAVSVFVNGIAAPVTNGTFTVTGIVLTEGMNTIIATAYDNLNNVTTASVNVTLDSTAPNVVIVSPKDGDVLRSSAVTVTGLMNDIVRGTVNAGQGRVLVNGIEAVVSNRGFLAENVPLNPGVNTITAVGADQVGNISRASIAVTFNTAPAKGLTITGGSSQTGVIGTRMPVPLSVVLRDANGSPISAGTVIFEVVDNNGKVTAVDETLVLAKSPSGHRVALQSDGNGAARVNLTLGTWAGAGNNRVEVSTTGVKERAVFIASATASAAAYVHVGSGGDQRGAVNHLLPEPLVATVTDTGHNPVEGVPVTFTVKKGGGVFTNDAGSMTVTTDSDGRATVNMILGPEAGNDVHWAEADFAGNGGSPAIFVATGLIPGDPGETRISGVILDNMNQPVPGVMARVDGTTRQDASDSQGQFVIDNVPIGPVHLIIEGSTATVPGEWPLLSFELTTIAGANNTLGKPIYLLPIDIARAKRVGGSKDVVYTLPEVPGFSLTVKAGSVTFPDGSREGLISVTPVHMDKVPMSPPYGLQSRFMITIQPPGAVFDPPAPLSLPNTEGLERGEKVNLFSFDHDLGAFVSIGPGSVSSDGIRVVSDPGVGVIKAGWHCGANPQPVGMCQSEPPMCGGQLTGCGACEICDTTNCWRLPDCYEACGGARCGSCEDCVDGSCVVETRGNPPCQPLAGSCRDCPVEWDCVTCESNICIFRGCGGPADDDGTCTPACDTCTHCSQGRCYPDDTCEDDSSSCVGTCGSCQVCRNDSCVRDGRCDMDDQESNGNEGDFCGSVLPCRVCLQCENSACAVGDLPSCLDNLDVVITPPGPVIMPVGGTRRLTSVGGPLAGTYAWSVSDSSVVGIQGSSTARNIIIEGLSAGTATVTVSFTAQGKTVTDSVEVAIVSVDMTAYRPVTEGPAYGNPFQRRAIADSLEESPGAGIRINGDSESSANENDLIEVQLDVTPFPVPSGVAYVLRRSNANIKVWDSCVMGTALLDSGTEAAVAISSSLMPIWIENPGGGSADLELIARSGTVDVVSDKVHFYGFQAIVIGLSGEVWPGDNPLANGMYDVAEELYDRGYDIHYYDEDSVDDNGAGAAYDEVVRAIQHREVTRVGIYGHSHGGGSTHDLAARLDADRAAIDTFTISFTAYIDAVTQGAITQENRRPPGSSFHVNYYQEGVVNPFASDFDSGLDGGPVSGADYEVNVDQPTPTQTHGTIDDDPNVLNGIESRLTPKLTR